MQARSAVRRFWNDAQGSTMVEFSIVAFLFVLLLLGIGEFGIATWARNSVADAAREGTRYAIVRGQKSGQIATTATVNTYVQSRSSLKPITVTTTWPDGGSKEAGKMVVVTVAYDYKRVGLVIPNKTLSSTSKMVIVY